MKTLSDVHTFWQIDLVDCGMEISKRLQTFTYLYMDRYIFKLDGLRMHGLFGNFDFSTSTWFRVGSVFCITMYKTRMVLVLCAYILMISRTKLKISNIFCALFLFQFKRYMCSMSSMVLFPKYQILHRNSMQKIRANLFWSIMRHIYRNQIV